MDLNIYYTRRYVWFKGDFQVKFRVKNPTNH